MMRSAHTAAVMILASALLKGQVVGRPTTDSTVSSPRKGWLSVTTLPGKADVYLDSLYLGKSPVLRAEVPPGRHMIKVFSPSISSWEGFAETEAVEILADKETQRILELGNVWSLNSIPTGVGVFGSGVEIGRTPLLLKTSFHEEKLFTLRKNGYEDAIVSLNNDSSTTCVVRLNRLNHQEGSMRSDVLLENNNDGKFDQWLTLASGTTMIVSGVLSAYLKHRANKEFDNYAQTFDPQSLASTHRLDRQASTAFIVSQISFAVLTFVFLSD